MNEIIKNEKILRKIQSSEMGKSLFWCIFHLSQYLDHVTIYMPSGHVENKYYLSSWDKIII